MQYRLKWNLYSSFLVSHGLMEEIRILPYVRIDRERIFVDNNLK
jgi:hypothetical protein